MEVCLYFRNISAYFFSKRYYNILYAKVMQMLKGVSLMMILSQLLLTEVFIIEDCQAYFISFESKEYNLKKMKSVHLFKKVT